MTRVIFATLDYIAHARAMWLKERLACWEAFPLDLGFLL